MNVKKTTEKGESKVSSPLVAIHRFDNYQSRNKATR